MATDQGSNNLDDFDIEQVINWEEHNYASKNLDIQHLPELDLVSSGLSQGHATQPSASHGRSMLLNNQVIGTHQPSQREQSSSIARPLSQTSNSILNPVFPRDAGYMISDIRQELTHSRQILDTPRDVQPSFPSENFDVPSIGHQRAHRAAGSQALNFLPGHDQRLSTQHVVPASPLSHNIPRHPSLHNGMQRFSQTAIPSSITNVSEAMDPDLDSQDGNSSSIDQLIEDIVDREMPQGVGDTVMFSSHDVPLGGQHQQINHAMAPSGTTLTSSNQNQIPGMSRNSSVISSSAGSPLPVTGQVSGSSLAHAHSPLSQNPASPIIGTAPSPQMQQYKAGPLRSGRGATKKTVTMPTQQQPHSPQNLAMGLAHSPRPTPQRSPQNAPQRSPQNAPQRSPQNAPQRSPQQPSAQSPPASVNAVMSQNMPSPLSQASPMSSGGMQMNSQVMGNIGIPHSPVASPLNIPSPQNQRSSRQLSPASVNIGSPLTPSPVANQDYALSQPINQNYLPQQAKVVAPKAASVQNVRGINNNTSNSTVTGISTTVQNTAWSQGQFIPRQSTNLSQNVLSTQAQSHPHGTVIKSQVSSTPQPGTGGTPVSTFDTATVLRGLTALKGTNVIPLQLKQGATNQLQAVKLPQNYAGIDLLKQAMLVKAGQGGNNQPAGKPMAINTSQGQVICYILPKQTGDNSASQTSTTQGQQVKMVVISTSNISTTSNVVKMVNSSNVDTTVTPSIGDKLSSSSPFTSVTKSSVVFADQKNVCVTSKSLQSPMLAMTSVIKAVGDSRDKSQNQNNNNTGIQQAATHTQSIDTTKITFVNESTCIDHFVSVPGIGQSAVSVITTYPSTATVSTTATKTTPAAASSSSHVVIGDSDDSDTPLAVLAETLKKSYGDEKKKKKKKKDKAEKRKKKDKSGNEKPLPVFQIFFKETQAAIRQQNPSIDFENVTKIVTQLWDKLPEEQKKVYYLKHEKSKREYEKSVEKHSKQEPSPKIRKVEHSASTHLPSPKTTAPSSATTTSIKDSSTKQESITLKIPKAVLNKAEAAAPKIPKAVLNKTESATPKIPNITPAISSSKVTASATAPSPTTFSPAKKKAKVAFNPIAQRICIREGCNMPARTTKDRGTQYCSNECIVVHCRNVFQSWVNKRKHDAIHLS